jgi:hypothetical protein
MSGRYIADTSVILLCIPGSTRAGIWTPLTSLGSFGYHHPTATSPTYKIIQSDMRTDDVLGQTFAVVEPKQKKRTWSMAELGRHEAN